MFLVSSCSCLCPIQWSQLLSREWRCSWSSADRRCSTYIWVIDNFIAYQGASYIRDLTVIITQLYLLGVVMNAPQILGHEPVCRRQRDSIHQVRLYSLQWRHNERDNVSNHQPHDCISNCLFRRRSKKTSKHCVTGLCAGKSPVTSEFPAQGPVTRKMFSFDDVIMFI